MKRLTLLGLAFCATAATAEPRQPRAATNLEMQNMAQAMEFFYLDYNRFTTLENLDDTFANPANPLYDGINQGGGALLIEPNTSQIQRQVLVPDIFAAGPPYLTGNSSRDYEGPTGDYDEGGLLDLWGNPYYFYSPLGLIEPKSASISTSRYYGDSFVYYTIVSHGPDGIKSGDDAFHTLPYTIHFTAISSARLKDSANRAVTYDLVIRGFQLGATQGSGDVLFNGVSSGATVTVWSASQVIASLPGIPPEGTQVSIRTGGGATSGSVLITNELPPTSVTEWAAYK
ncbi:hypothetical protein IT570_04650 [Candidatus Sumerlaeota bacterium]|nr:hypothetical protein [Candidatus Sumerlaeota bacterium]